ncbi:MAG: hypothetical protein D6746_00965 [Bacteroidetes bacterium]|nr:MAG: hypothetical protein D6746_00965 [Bacteroidota bacterium]
MPARLVLLIGLCGGLLTLGGAGCAPSLSPLYRDYEVVVPDTTRAADLSARIATALQQAGWELGESPTAPLITTRPRTLNNWGIYRVEVALEVAPLHGNYVRVFIHPYRRFFTGGRSKIPYLRGSIERAILPDLTKAFEAQGLHLRGSAIERDREATER